VAGQCGGAACGATKAGCCAAPPGAAKGVIFKNNVCQGLFLKIIKKG
jgi:hypothetical protein